MRHRPYDEFELSPGVKPMVDDVWLYQHWHDLDGWQPKIELISEHGHYTLSGNQKQVNEAIKEYTRR